MDKLRFMKQMAYFLPSLVGNEKAITPQLFRLHFSIDCSFKMRYCMNLYLNWHRDYKRSKIEFPNSIKSMLQPYIIPVLGEIEVQTVPDFKATVNAKMEPEGLECDGIFIS